MLTLLRVAHFSVACLFAGLLIPLTFTVASLSCEMNLGWVGVLGSVSPGAGGELVFDHDRRNYRRPGYAEGVVSLLELTRTTEGGGRSCQGVTHHLLNRCADFPP